MGVRPNMRMMGQGQSGEGRAWRAEGGGGPPTQAPRYQLVWLFRKAKAAFSMPALGSSHIRSTSLVDLSELGRERGRARTSSLWT